MVSMDKVVSLCKRRGFIFPSSEIYGGINGFWDYGPLGVELLRRVKDAWWNRVVVERDDVVGLDSAIIQNPRVWEVSGHVGGFSDPMVDCKTCKSRFRADNLDSMQCTRKPSCAPGKGPDCQLTDAKEFNLMFQTKVGASADEDDPSAIAYLRPETAQGMFTNFGQVLQTSRKKPPFGIAQVGKSFRNEITPQNWIFRTREFEQGELEFFCAPAEAPQWHEYWLQERMHWYTDLGMNAENLRLRAHEADELSHYSAATSDLEYRFPWGWDELEGISNRTDFDFTARAEHSGQDLR